MCASVTTSATQTYAEMFEIKDKYGFNSNSIHHEHLQQLAGRVTRGSKEADFVYLQKDATAKKFAWVMGEDGLTLFLTQSNVQALRTIGCEDRWIRMKLENGEHFRLGIFHRSDECVLATWDGMLSVVNSHYPATISSKIRRHVDELKQMSFDEIEERARLSYLVGAAYFDIDESAVDGNSNDPRFMSEERFSKCEGTLEECRGFLYNLMGLSDLFDGSGFTKDFTGRLGVREYLQLNVPVRDLSGFRYLHLSIDDTDLMPDA